jgi:hypothetical protein
MQRSHWIRLLLCKFDTAYVTSAVRVGKILYAQGVAPSLYIAGYSSFHSELIDAVTKCQSNLRDLSAVLTSISRVICLDMDQSLSVYTQENGYKQLPEGLSEWIIEESCLN